MYLILRAVPLRAEQCAREARQDAHFATIIPPTPRSLKTAPRGLKHTVAREGLSDAVNLTRWRDYFSRYNSEEKLANFSGRGLRRRLCDSIDSLVNYPRDSVD